MSEVSRYPSLYTEHEDLCLYDKLYVIYEGGSKGIYLTNEERTFLNNGDLFKQHRLLLAHCT